MGVVSRYVRAKSYNHATNLVVRVHNEVFSHFSTNQNKMQHIGMLSLVERFVKGRHFVVLMPHVPIEGKQLNGFGFSFEFKITRAICPVNLHPLFYLVYQVDLIFF